MKEFWQGLERSARIGLIAGVLTIGFITMFAAWWLLRTDYQVLFSDLKPQDTAAMAAELDRQKIPYVIGDSGNAILVDKAIVLATRIKLMGKDLPLHGAVGFELFNNTDFGMTEFAQKINYQRALQGELTRTILSLAEIADVRVHLALPEQGLFKQVTSRPKAAITVTLHPGQMLRAEQIGGIQRLVAAAVPDMQTADVTIVDNQGVALTRVAGVGESDLGSARLDLKKETENYLSHKAETILERTFGPGQALVSVDVTLNMDQVHVTTEDVLPATERSGAIPTGVLVHERESTHDSTAPLDAKDGSGNHVGNSQREIEYQVGRRVEQVVGQPGSIQRLQVVAVIRQLFSPVQEEQLRKMLTAAVGALPERGDTVVLQTLLSATSGAARDLPAASEPPEETATATHDQTPLTTDSSKVLWILIIALICVILIASLFYIGRRTVKSGNVALTDAERQAALRQINVWMQRDKGPL